MSSEDDEKKQPSSEDEKERIPDEQYFTVFSEVGHFFGWLGELITDQARIDATNLPDDPPPLHVVHEITLRQQKTGEVVANAKKICQNLDELKQKLSSEFGAHAGSFITKCIDPMVEHAKELIEALENPANKSLTMHGLLEQAIESVELYSQFSDESKLKRKIVQVAQGFIKQAIDKDLEVLANYKMQALDNSKCSQQERQNREFQLDRYLYPIASELIGMAESRVETDDLQAFMVWKINVDERRNALIELGLLSVDSLVGQRGLSIQLEEKEAEEPLGELVRHQLEEVSLDMSFLATLEDRAMDLLSRIDEEESVDTLQQLLDYLKADAERFEAITHHTKHVLESFHQLRENLVKVQSLLQLKRES